MALDAPIVPPKLLDIPIPSVCAAPVVYETPLRDLQDYLFLDAPTSRPDRSHILPVPSTQLASPLRIFEVPLRNNVCNKECSMPLPWPDAALA